MRIRADLFQSLSQAARSDFLARLYAHVEQHYPEAVIHIGPPELALQLEQAVSYLTGRGITAERNVTWAIHLLLSLGDHLPYVLEKHRWLDEILSDSSLDESQKVYSITAGFV